MSQFTTGGFFLDIRNSHQAAEHSHAGMPCGIMDQFISVIYLFFNNKKLDMLLSNLNTNTNSSYW